MTPLDVVKGTYEAFGRRDLPAILARFSPDIEIVQSDELPWGGRYRGHDGARQFLGKLTAAIASTLEIERLLSAGDQVVAIGWTMGKVNRTGASYRVPIAHVWKIRAGLVVEVQFLIDNPTMLAALAEGNMPTEQPRAEPS
jgi:ketosteroid isomerase-like protein